MAHIQKRGPARYRARYRTSSGRELSKTFRRKSDAENFVATIEAAKLRGDWTNPTLGKTKFSAWNAQVAATTVNLRPSTKARDESYIRNHIEPFFGKMPLTSIDQIDVRAWVAGLDAKGLAPATVRKAYQLFERIMQAAVDARYIPQSPCRNIPIPKLTQEEMRFLRPGEITQLASTIDPRYSALVWVAAYAGLRMGELAGLRRWRVDLLRSEIRVSEIMVEVKGELIFGPPKTNRSVRTVRLPGVVRERLEEHLEAYTEPASDLVFTSPDGKALRATNFRRRAWNPAVKAAGLTPLRPHDLRHTAISIWIANGANAKQVSMMAGHGSAAFTLDRYGHLFPDHEDELMKKLDEVGRGAATEPIDGTVLPFPEAKSG